MKAALKFGMITIGLTLIAIGVSVIFLRPHVERVTADALESVLSDVFGSRVTVGGLAISPARRSLDLHHVSLANPEGFKQGPAIESKRVRLQFQWPSVVSGTPIVREAILEDADIYYRYEIGEGTNLKRLEELAEEYGDSRPRSPFSIGEIRCEEAKVHLSTNLLPLASVGVDIVNVVFKEPENDDSFSVGKTLAEFVGRIAKEIVAISGILLPEEKEE